MCVCFILFLGVIALSQELGNLAKGLKHLSLSRVSMTARGTMHACRHHHTQTVEWAIPQTLVSSNAGPKLQILLMIFLLIKSACMVLCRGENIVTQNFV